MKPSDPGGVQAGQVGQVAGHDAAPERDVDVDACSRAAARLASSAATVVVGGIELSGMSTSVVTPPAAAARVAVAKPSHSVRPGSLMCTWLSTSPGISTWSSAMSTVVSATGGSSYAAIGHDHPVR